MLTANRSETAANWAASTLVPRQGEVLLATDTGAVKVGDGVNTWTHLPLAETRNTSAVELLEVSDATGQGKQVYNDTPTLLTPIVTGGTFASPALTTPVFTVANAVAASATQTQVAATALTKDINRVTTVGTAGDAVKLPAATAGAKIIVKNAHATNSMGVFPSSGDKINALATDAVYALAATKAAQFFCAVAGQWDTILTA